MRIFALKIIGWLAVGSMGLLPPACMGADGEVTGVVLDDSSAELYGEWSKSTHTAGFFGEGYIYSPPMDETKATFALPLPADGKYQVLVSYTPGSNRTTSALVRVLATDGDVELRINQQLPASGPGIFHALGEFAFAGDQAVIEISTAGSEKGVVIVDAVRLLTAEQFAEAQKQEPKFDPTKVVSKPKAPVRKEAKPSAEPEAKAPEFVRAQPQRAVQTITSEQLDQLLSKHLGP